MKERVNKFSVVVLMALLGDVPANGRENKNSFRQGRSEVCVNIGQLSY